MLTERAWLTEALLTDLWLATPHLLSYCWKFTWSSDTARKICLTRFPDYVPPIGYDNPSWSYQICSISLLPSRHYVRLRSLGDSSKSARFRDQEQSARWTSDHSTFRGCRRAPGELDIGNTLSLALESSVYKRACTITILKRHEGELSLLRILIIFSLRFGRNFRRWQDQLKTHVPFNFNVQPSLPFAHWVKLSTPSLKRRR